MNEDEARLVRIVQYLLSKDVHLKQELTNRERYTRCKDARSYDIYCYLLSFLKYEFFKEFMNELWKLMK